MKKPKRVSLAVKVNIVIMAMVLSVSELLTLISENAYQKADLTIRRCYALNTGDRPAIMMIRFGNHFDYRYPGRHWHEKEFIGI